MATNAAFTQDLAIFDEDRNSSISAKLVPTTNAAVELKYDDFVEVREGFWYSFSMYERSGFIGEPADDLTGKLGIEWYDANQLPLETTEGPVINLSEFYSVDKFYRVDGILTVFTVETTSLAEGDNVRFVDFTNTSLNGTYTVTFASGRYFKVVSAGANIPETEGSVERIQDLKFDFTRLSYSELSPDNAVYAKPYFVWTNALTTQSINLDSVMFESANAPKPYFDGYSGFTSTDDLIWEDNVAFNARSHYYKNRVATQLRLIDQLPNFLMVGTPFSIYLAQPGL